MKHSKYISICLTVVFTMMLFGCVKDYLDVPVRPKPKIGIKTDSLEASYITSPISSVNDPFWKEANFIDLELEDLSTQNLYIQDGLLNMTGSYNGLEDFNGGIIPEVKLRAAYDDDNIYILVEWDDSRMDATRRNWFWNGPADPLKPNDTAGMWTSQRNDDKVALAFDINNAESPNGKFSEVGCAAACHQDGSNDIMGPELGAIDIWNWSLALSAPFGYAFDMVSDSDSALHFDKGTRFYHRNSNNSGNHRAGPAFEWDGNTQNITKTDGNPSILDPAFYLLNRTPFIGDPAVGMVLYNDHDKGCVGCHGEEGTGYGELGDGPPFDNAGFSRIYSRTALDNFASDATHEGNTYYEKLSQSEREDLMAYIKGLPGIPGYYLTEPLPGESLTDITATSDANLVRVETDDTHDTYRVLFTRRLNTGYSDDISFHPENGQAYIFGVALMDNDGKNHIGSLKEALIFKD